MTALVLQNHRRPGPSPHRTSTTSSDLTSFAPAPPANHFTAQHPHDTQRARESHHNTFYGPSSSNAMPSAEMVNGAGHADPRASARRTFDDDSNHDAGPSSSKRPSSAPGVKNDLAVGFPDRSSTDVSDAPSRPVRPTKPALLRSKSEYAAVRNTDDDEPIVEERREWGARHGFEDHYQSQDIISQLANVREPTPHSAPTAGSDRDESRGQYHLQPYPSQPFSSPTSN